MGNIALIMTDLVAVADTHVTSATAEIFKKINLAAAANKNCVFHLEDEDETPEIFNPELGTLFVSFSIWNDAAACENFRAEHDAGRYVTTSWELTGDTLPSLNEAFGRIALRGWPSAVQAALPISMFEAAGRRWLQDNLGDVNDPFIYDHWVGETPDTQTDERPAPTFMFGGKKVSLFKHPFGAKPAPVTAQLAQPLQDTEPALDLTAEVQGRIHEFEQKMEPYNFHLGRQLAGYALMDHAEAGSVVNWAWGRISFLNEYIEYSKRYTDKGYPQLFNAVTAELNRWKEAYAKFTAHHSAKEQAAVQRIYQRANDQRREDDKIHNEKMRKINDDINEINRQTYDNTVRSYAERNEMWSDAHLGRERYVVLKKVY